MLTTCNCGQGHLQVSMFMSKPCRQQNRRTSPLHILAERRQLRNRIGVEVFVLDPSFTGTLTSARRFGTKGS